MLRARQQSRQSLAELRAARGVSSDPHASTEAAAPSRVGSPLWVVFVFLSLGAWLWPRTALSQLSADTEQTTNDYPDPASRAEARKLLCPLSKRARPPRQCAGRRTSARPLTSTTKAGHTQTSWYFGQGDRSRTTGPCADAGASGARGTRCAGERRVPRAPSRGSRSRS